MDRIFVAIIISALLLLLGVPGLILVRQAEMHHACTADMCSQSTGNFCPSGRLKKKRAAFSLYPYSHKGDWDMPRSILVTLWSLGAACLFAFGIAVAIMVH